MEIKNKYLVNYIKTNIRRFEIKFSKKTDADIISWLESKDNVTDYIKQLILEDKKKSTD